MSVKIPIWPGSSSFSAGDTPFGIYDSDASFIADADKIAKWCAQRLGYPLSEIELQDIHFYTCFEEAVSEYGAQLNAYNIRDNMLNLQGASTSSNLTGQNISAGLGGVVALAEEYGVETGTRGNVTWYTGSIAMTRNKQIYDLTDPTIVSLESGTAGQTEIEIKRIYHEPPPALVRFFDPFIGSGVGTQQMLDAFGFGSFSPGVSFMMMPIYADILRLQAIEFNDLVRRSAYSFEIHNNRIRIFPIPDGNAFNKIYFEYIKKADRSNPLKTGNGHSTGTISDFSNVPYNNVIYNNVNSVGRQWIRRYALALAKEMLGWVRSKYSSIPIPNAEITLNGADLISSAQTEKDALIQELKDILDTMSRQSQLERKQAEATALQGQMNFIPLKIYIG
jgi:hypothetical protein